MSNMKHKIIIQNDTDYSPQDALKFVTKVMNMGMISNGTYGLQYCFLTTYGKNPTTYVSCDKRKSGTYKFIVSNRD